MRLSHRLTLAAALLALVATPLPVEAATADPGLSVVTVQVPGLAPGSVGTAPLYGEMNSSGAFVLHAPVSQAHTGNSMQEGLLRRFVPGTVSITAESGVLVRRLRHGQTMRMLGTVYAAGTTMRVPLFVRVTEGSHGKSLRTFFRVPLAAYGIRKLGGDSAGDVRVAISAVFKD